MSYIDPHRMIEKTVLIYTTMEGGESHTLFGFSKKSYSELLERGYFDICTGDRETRIRPAYATIATLEDGYDFILEKINIKNGYKKESVPSFNPEGLKRFMEAKR